MAVLDVFFLIWFGLLCEEQGFECVDDLPDNIEVELPPVQEEGIASYYGSGKASENGMHGRITATGEPFIPSNMTCASRTIPLGSEVIIEIEESGNWAICEVNDRGPYGAIMRDGTWVAMLPPRGGGWTVLRRKNNEWISREQYSRRPATWRGVMDLSYGMAQALDFDFNRGLNPIRIRYVESSNGVELPVTLRIQGGYTLREKFSEIKEKFLNTQTWNWMLTHSAPLICPADPPKGYNMSLYSQESWR